MSFLTQKDLSRTNGSECACRLCYGRTDRRKESEKMVDILLSKLNDHHANARYRFPACIVAMGKSSHYHFHVSKAYIRNGFKDITCYLIQAQSLLFKRNHYRIVLLLLKIPCHNSIFCCQIMQRVSLVNLIRNITAKAQLDKKKKSGMFGGREMQLKSFRTDQGQKIIFAFFWKNQDRPS